ncbi:hypothetical protein [Streptomyces sp. NPDC059783]|uniref:hypothetical protein n=1 Tax=Streptomyces sp. NPDC059783 TaxID=3346944 RepID=UPI00364900B9
MKTHSDCPTGYITITPGPGPYDRECPDIVRVIRQRLAADETVTIQQGKPGNAQAVRDLHERYDSDAGGAYCNLCSNHGDTNWPCATIRALDGTKQ